jgi:hypothetical protein
MMSKTTVETPGPITSGNPKGSSVQLTSSALGASRKQTSSVRIAESGIFVQSAHSKKANISQAQADRAVKNYLSGK